MKYITGFYADNIDVLINKLQHIKDAHGNSNLIVKPASYYPQNLSEQHYTMYEVWENDITAVNLESQ